VAGTDPQLDKAVALALSALKGHRPLSADLARRPRLELPTLPPRSGAAGNGAGAAKPAEPEPVAPVPAVAPKGVRKTGGKPSRKGGG
jgi:hypothetical protein